ncbi:MAG: pncC [Phycisphaerales bacterium]|jgi:nicotinamide-nucleotide amidase|nr:pncC [Phycisphaerales bacterium]
MSATPSQPAWRDALNEGRRFADLVHGRLVALGQTVAAAESLTGGLISALLTEMAGTTVTFRGGLVVYATDVKHSIAGVDDRALAEHGPVHSVIAEQLACRVREKLDADYGIGATGVAGPGEQDGHPVGEVFIAIASSAAVSTKRYEFAGTRGDIRLASTAAALSDLVDVLTAACGDT